MGRSIFCSSSSVAAAASTQTLVYNTGRYEILTRSCIRSTGAESSVGRPRKQRMRTMCDEAAVCLRTRLAGTHEDVQQLLYAQEGKLHAPHRLRSSSERILLT